MARDAGQLYPAARAVMRPLFGFLWRFCVEGLENVPASGPAIIAPNHTSVIDSFFLPVVLPRRITYVGKAEYLDDWKTKHLFPALGMIPIDRSGGDASQAALDAAERVLRKGELFGIYPEGTRSRTGKLHRGHTGPARLALRTGAPIIPVGLIGTRAIQPPDAPVPKVFRPVIIRFGRPVTVDRYRDRADDRLVLRQIIDEVMFEIRELTGQEYVNTYAGKDAAEAAPGAGRGPGDTSSGLPAAPGPNGSTEATMPRRTAAEALRAAAQRAELPQGGDGEGPGGTHTTIARGAAAAAS